MFNKLKRFFKKAEKEQVTISSELLERVIKEHLFKFTDSQTLIIKEDCVLGKINKVEKIKPGTLVKGTFAFIYLFEVETGGKRAEFLTFNKALDWLLQQTISHW